MHINSVSDKPNDKVVYGYATISFAPKSLAKIVNQKTYFILKYEDLRICPGQDVKVACKLIHIKDSSKKPFEQFLFKNHVFLYCCDGNIVSEESEASKFSQFCLSARKKLFALLESGIEHNNCSGILVGMLTGAKSKVSKSQREDFRDAGVAHVFAVSGLHIGLIALFLDWIFRIFLVPRKLRAFPVLGILFVYLNIIGPMPSSIRAFLMIFFYYLAILVGRKPNVLSAYTFSLLIYTLYSPTVVYNISFLLSYCVVFGIIMMGDPLNQLCEKFFNRRQIVHPDVFCFLQRLKIFLTKYLLASFCTSLAACGTSLIISVEFFGQISCLTVLFNIIVVPLASLAIIFGSFSIMCGVLGLTFLCQFINRLAILPIMLIQKCFNITRGFHHGMINVDWNLRGLWLISLPLIALAGQYILYYCKQDKPRYSERVLA